MWEVQWLYLCWWLTDLPFCFRILSPLKTKIFVCFYHHLYKSYRTFKFIKISGILTAQLSSSSMDFSFNPWGFYNPLNLNIFLDLPVHSTSKACRFFLYSTSKTIHIWKINFLSSLSSYICVIVTQLLSSWQMQFPPWLQDCLKYNFFLVHYFDHVTALLSPLCWFVSSQSHQIKQTWLDFLSPSRLLLTLITF